VSSKDREVGDTRGGAGMRMGAKKIVGLLLTSSVDDGLMTTSGKLVMRW